MKYLLILFITLSATVLRAQSLGGFVVAPLISNECVASISMVPTNVSEDGGNLIIVGSLTSVVAQQIINENAGTDKIESLSEKPAHHPTQIFDIEGRKIESMKKGVNLVRDSDGKTSKVLVILESPLRR